MGLELTVLGCAGSHTGPGRVCSGYLVTADGTRLLVDCGNGATANLQRFCRFDELDAIVVTHRHVDHCIDLVGMYYGLRFHRDGAKRIDLYAAAEVVDTLTGLLSADSALGFHDVFEVHEVTADTEVTVGPLALTFAESVHPVPTVSVAIEHAGRRLVYSSDSAGGPALIELARGADLLLCEATWQGDPDAYPDGMHLTARGAAEVAREAGVARLVLTHVLGSLDPRISVTEATEVFPGPVEAAADLRSWVV
ncbi:MBL fold metallo-hydrolase [Egicoccus sp. AB-alg6-2]|uniref:MBL fold metallo-hydrolase n=1 Tax=Egicoccus sp. AB-alg6-2 TaxID=3242692 RepID=UPI00359ED8D3